MNPQDHRTIERLLEQLGADEVPGDPGHRYALRRSLLNSRYFEVHRARVIWERIITISGPGVAGAFVVAMVVLAVYVNQAPSETPVSAEQMQMAQMAPEPQAEQQLEPVDEQEFLPNVQVVDFRQHEPVVRLVDFVNSNMETAIAR